eukprot:TRINITY_DN530_c0_g3_i1.p1 TRINITY_DN530_c0_g3~~TRINITY_DN530_c0_g3_i1.p1  ORF type:complete len:283 (+),score=35.63 TRINITY_DN530_c0_g3_i1:72-920(+)
MFLIRVLLFAVACILFYYNVGLFFIQNLYSSEAYTKDKNFLFTISLQEAYTGFSKEHRYNKIRLCSVCSGSGAHSPEDTRSCPTCNGKGSVTRNMYFMGSTLQKQEQCPKCRGTGHRKLCTKCKGQGVEQGFDVIQLQAPGGIPENYEMKFEKKSDEVPGKKPGSVIVQITTDKHPIFRRDKNNYDLHVNLKITLLEALVGFSKHIKHLDGHLVYIFSDNVVQPEEVLTVPQEGMPMWDNPNQKGTLHIHLTVNFPDRLTAQQENEIKELFESITFVEHSSK